MENKNLKIGDSVRVLDKLLIQSTWKAAFDYYNIKYEKDSYPETYDVLEVITKPFENIKDNTQTLVFVRNNKTNINYLFDVKGLETYIEPKKINYFVPELNEGYYYYLGDGEVNYFKYKEDRIDKNILSSKIVYKTREEAEKELKRQREKIKVIKRIAELNEGWIPNWKDNNQYKIYISYDYNMNKLQRYITTSFKEKDNNLYLKNQELAEQLIKEMPNELKLMLEVEEGK